ncbi:MAG TPA: S24 family peptidase [Aliidongia sp.]|uniref:XRE family transcriptional regulator n=1 Tax=Aliidongia sp. TaxID=1914230 RepID=UPI002DDD8D4A|nr:S24 family peptidase [Aliidongia sp.]HEV2677675.1 S24 family peptidase [Aliidongia sp.]
MRNKSDDIASSPFERGGERQAFVARLQFVLDHWPSADKLAKAAGISPSALRKWLRGEAEPSRERLITFADAARVEIAWLVRGEGDQPQLADASTRRRDGAGPEGPGQSGGEEFLVLPHRPKAAAAGSGKPEPETPAEFIAFRHDWIRTVFDLDPEHVMLISAAGDSMEPGIRDGDLLLVDTRQAAFTEFGIYVFEARGERLVKRVQRKFDGTLYVISDNTVYQPEIISSELATEIKVIGKVIWRGGGV